MKALQPQLNSEDKGLMEKLLSARCIEQKYVRRLQTVLLRTRGKETGEIADSLGIQQGTVSLYIKRYNNFGIGSPLRNRTHKPRKEPVSLETKNEICHQQEARKRDTLEHPYACEAGGNIAYRRQPDIARARAETAQGVQAHSTDSAFEAKLMAVVWLYVSHLRTR